MDWVAKIILTILGLLVCAVFILLGFHFANDLFHFWPVHIDSIRPCDKFEIYRDLLIILLATLGVIGYFVYKEIRGRLLQDLTRSIKEHENLIFSRLYNHLAYIHCREYENIDPADQERRNRYEDFCDLAIEEAESAVSFCERLVDKKHESMISVTRINLAYHLAARRNQEDKDRGLSLAKENWQKALEYKSEEEHNIRETLVWVTLKCSDDQDERKKAERDLVDLLKWKSISKEWKEEMAKKYSQHFGITLNFET